MVPVTTNQVLTQRTQRSRAFNGSKGLRCPSRSACCAASLGAASRTTEPKDAAAPASGGGPRGDLPLKNMEKNVKNGEK